MNQTKEFCQYLQRQGLKVTQQRQEIARIFLRSNRHLSADKVYQNIRRKDPQVGLSTVYRTLKLLVEADLASRREFEGGITRYEPKTGHQHHDHLICVNCGAIIEFENQKIEALQREVAERHQFAVLHHKLELYGYCQKCRQSVGQHAGKKGGAKRQLR